jgi:hypothetical protein
MIHVASIEDIQVILDSGKPLLVFPLHEPNSEAFEMISARASGLNARLRHTGFGVQTVFVRPHTFARFTSGFLTREHFALLLKPEPVWVMLTAEQSFRSSSEQVRCASEEVIKLLGLFQK